MKTQTNITNSLTKTQQVLIMLVVAGMISGVTFTSTAFVSAATHTDTDPAVIDEQTLELLIEEAADAARADEPIHYGENDDRPYSERAYESGPANESDGEYTATEETATPVTIQAPVTTTADPLATVLDNVVLAVDTIQGNLDAGSMTEAEATELLENLIALVAIIAQMSSQQ